MLLWLSTYSSSSRFLSIFIALSVYLFFIFFFFNDTATTEIYTLSLHDALPILRLRLSWPAKGSISRSSTNRSIRTHRLVACRSEEHTSELQSLAYLVCRLLLEKKKKAKNKKIFNQYII